MLSLAHFSVVPTECQAFEITIDVAPNVLNLQNNDQVVTVHTDIAYGVVQASTVYLNHVAKGHPVKVAAVDCFSPKC